MTRGLVLRGGSVFDPESGEFAERDLRIVDGLFADGPAQPDDAIRDVTGLIVSPGLVDLHTHVFVGQDLGLDPTDIAAPSGTTVLVDTGSAGAHLFGAFRRSTVERSATLIRAFLNVSSVGATSIMLGGELKAPYYVSEGAAVDAIEANRDLIVGVKVRASADVGGDNATGALHAARRVADRVGLPLMVHLGPAPAAVDEIASVLGKGDILTHAFTGWPDNAIVRDGWLRDSVREARARGALLDIGHGMSGFSANVARDMLALGELPDTISTDLHAYSRELVVDFPTVLSKFLSFGMSLEDVLVRATLAPSRAVGLDRGTIRVGAPADVAVLRRTPRSVEFTDGFGARWSGNELLECVMTVSGGEIVYGDAG